MCVFNTYVRLQEELKELQKEIKVASKNYNDELKLFQKGNIIDSPNAEKVKAKYDSYQQAQDLIEKKQTEIENIENEIKEYLKAMNGMAIRHQFQKQDRAETLVFDLETNDYGEQSLLVAKED